MCMPDKREVGIEFAALWEKDGWSSFFDRHRDDLFLGIRHNAVNLYYRGYSLCKIELKGQGNKQYLYATTHKTYCGETVLNGENRYRKINLKELEDKYQDITKAMKTKNDTSLERIAQQQLIQQNNSTPSALWYCVDMEYIQARNSRKEDLYGRADILAVSKKQPGKIALIELKYGKKAIRDGMDRNGKRYSGACKHMEDFYSLLQSDKAKKYLWENIRSIISSYQQLHNDASFLSDYCKINYDQAVFQPYFIVLDSHLGDKKQDAQKYMRNFILKEGSDADYCFQKLYTIDVTDKPGGFYVKFLFSNCDTSDLGKIDRILDPAQYDSQALK